MEQTLNIHTAMDIVHAATTHTSQYVPGMHVGQVGLLFLKRQNRFESAPQQQCQTARSGDVDVRTGL